MQQEPRPPFLASALQFLTRRQHSEQELRMRLEERFSTEEDYQAQVQTTLNYLKKLGFLNDPRLAHNLSERYAHKGNHFILACLRQRGISEEIAKEALCQLKPESERAFIVAQKKMATLVQAGIPQTGQVLKIRLYQFLSGRGFAAANAANAIEKLLKSRASLETTCL